MSKKRHKNEVRKLRAKIEILKSQVSRDVIKQVEASLVLSEKKIDISSKISTAQALDMTGFILRDFRKSIVISILLFASIISLYLFGNNLINNF